jgi:hypothetical protein
MMLCMLYLCCKFCVAAATAAPAANAAVVVL